MRKIEFWALALGLALISILMHRSGGINARSRFAAMASICDGLPSSPDFRIDAFMTEPRWTEDWARTPDGHYYSNKAPGAILLGAPLYCALDWLAKPSGTTANSLKRLERLEKYDIVLSFFLQIVPLILTAGWALRAFAEAPSPARRFTVLALFFGTTAALFSVSYFGHGMSGVFTLCAALALYQRRWMALGLCIGLCVLNDYAGATLLPGLAIAGFLATKPGERIRAILFLFIGAAIPFALWCWYHNTSFGGILHIAQKYQNPLYVDMAQEQDAMWGVIGLFPRPTIVMKLLFGPERGLLFTQPWILVLMAYLPLALKKAWLEQPERRAQELPMVAFIVLGFCGHLWLNASFGGWHGGGASGPRYLSPSLAPFALLIPLTWQDLKPGRDKVLWRMLIYTFVINATILAVTLLAPPEPLWPYLVRMIGDHPWGFQKNLIIWVPTLALMYGLSRTKQSET